MKGAIEMESFRLAKEILDYTRQFRGKIIVVKVSKHVLAKDKKLGNVIRDIGLLKNAGIEVVVTHSDTHFRKDPWFTLEPVVFLDISTISDIAGHVAMGMTPVVFFGETSFLSSEKAIASLALKLGAIKIVYITNQDGVFQSGKLLVHEMNVRQVREMIAMSGVITHDMLKRVEVALMACEQGIPRIHIIGSREGSLFREILTCEGSGTMIYDRIYHGIRNAKKTDVSEIFEIIKESVKTSVPLDLIERSINDFVIFSVDHQVHGCMMIKDDGKAMEVSYLGASPAYQKPIIFQRLIEHALADVEKNERWIFLDPEKNTNLLGMYPWFKKLGFAKCSLRECGIANGNGNKVWVRKYI
ncbi:MAG TPA: hypothetical protein DIT25_04630 [Candidatus Moranbacteria bacterium]|nr:hypothetical protein [Candidatus Moranbacteria bacterium]